MTICSFLKRYFASFFVKQDQNECSFCFCGDFTGYKNNNRRTKNGKAYFDNRGRNWRNDDC